jgi:hypothetical protein
VTGREKRLDDAMLLQEFERAGLYADRTRVRRRLRRSIDDAHGDLRTCEAHRGGKPGWARADDQHGLLVCGGGHAFSSGEPRLA